MNTETPKLMNDDQPFFLQEETGNIISCAHEVLHTIGNGYKEKVYENAMCVEFKQRNIAFTQQRHYQIVYKDSYIGEFTPDLIVFDQVIVLIKVVDDITQTDCAQLSNFLKLTELKVGLILNFKHSTLKIKRIAL